MLNKVRKTLKSLTKQLLTPNYENRIFNSEPITSAHLNSDLRIHTGNSLVLKRHVYLFISRDVKFNIFFKKPLTRPSKRKKK